MPASYILESIFHDSQNKEYRYPAGAAEAMSFVRLRLQVKAQAENIHVWTRLWIDRSGEQLIVMEPDKKQGLTDKQRKARYSKDHSGEAIEERVKEYTMSKIEKAIEMVTRHQARHPIRLTTVLPVQTSSA